MAALGVVEIAEREPPLDLERKGKRVPVCAYDCLYAFRVTALGRYVLGFSDEKPSEPVRVFEAIADPELPLIAFRGRSLERRLFIESIGEPLGSERFRVTDASFSSGCSDAKAVARKVADFRRLIGQKPAPHWERLFSRTQAKASALGKPGHAYVFKAPAEPEVLRALIEAPSLRGLYARAEGGLPRHRPGGQGKGSGRWRGLFLGLSLLEHGRMLRLHSLAHHRTPVARGQKRHAACGQPGVRSRLARPSLLRELLTGPFRVQGQ